MKLIYTLMGLIILLALITGVRCDQLTHENVRLRESAMELMAADKKLKDADEELKRADDSLMASTLELQRVCASRLR